jgi:hypothetical protein
MKYKEISKQLIKKSIRSAICIDDMFVEPYMTTTEIKVRNDELSSREKREIVLDERLPRELHRSFRQYGECDLDIYNFRSMEESWVPNHMLNNKDLMVIDWELEGKDGYECTLKILKQAIDTNEFTTIPFIIIYTAKPIEDLQIIVEKIFSNFNPFSSTTEDLRLNLYRNFIDSFENCFEVTPDIDDITELFDKLKSKLYEYWKVVDVQIRNQIKFEIDNVINNELQILENKKIKTGNKFKTALVKTFGAKNDIYECLYYLNVQNGNTENYSVKRINSTEIGFKINTSILTIFCKDIHAGEGVKPEEVFNTFSELISNDPHNFLTLLSIEMRDKFRDDSFKVSERISSLDEKAFFYHLENYKQQFIRYKDQFYDFLLRSWTSEIEAYNLNQQPTVFSVLDEYVNSKNYKKIDKGAIHQEIADLITTLSTINILNRQEKDPEIRFGDIFKAKHPDRKFTYYLCITPQCVCVDPEKVDNNFFFLKTESVKHDLTSALTNIEKEFYSIIKDEGKNLSLKWGNCKPFTMWINTNNFYNLKGRYTFFDVQLMYVTTLKETFTQRIANKAFGYGTAIGIDLPHL